MKKVSLFVLMLFLAACGGGGGGGGAAGSTPAQPEVSGTITVEVKDAAAKTASAAPVDPQYVRISVTNPTLTISGQSFKVIRDVQLGSTGAVQFLLPQHDGYQVEALYYSVDTAASIKVMKKYGVTGSVTVSANAVTPVSLNVAPITVGITPTLPAGQDFVYAGVPSGTRGDTYGLVANMPAVSPLASSWSAFVQTTPFTTARHMPGISILNHTALSAPNSFTNGNLYYQGEFYAKQSLVDSGEAYTSWTFNYPNPAIDAAGNPYITMNVRGATVDLNSGSTSSLFSDTYAPRVSLFTAPTAVQTSAVISPIRFDAADNIGIVSYRIQETTGTPDPADAGTNWVNVTSTGSLSLTSLSYTIQGALAAGQDNVVKVYVRVKDAAGLDAVLGQNVTVHPAP